MYKGLLPSIKTFKFLFNYLREKARSVRGRRQTTKETPQPPSPFELATSFVKGRHGPERKLRLEQELIIVDFNETYTSSINSGFRVQIHVFTTTASSIFITWVKLMSRELSALIVCPSRQQVKKTLPSCFRKLCSGVRCIIDCFECFTEIPCGIDLAATLWSDYKHHYTFKVLVAITPNEAISYVSSC